MNPAEAPRIKTVNLKLAKAARFTSASFAKVATIPAPDEIGHETIP